MPESVKQFFSNRGIPPRRRVMGPVVSAIVSFLLPGAAQALNGQTVKGGSMLLAWFLMYSAAQLHPVVYNIVRIVQYIVMVVSSSDAYFIASRMKLGEEVRAWSVLFFDIHAPTGAAGPAGRQSAGQRTLITGAAVVDGTGAAPFRSDVLLEGGIIRLIRPGIPVKAKEYAVVDGTDRVLIPGFVNPCCCCEAGVFDPEESVRAVRQGITTEIPGQNGQSLAPIRSGAQKEALERFSAVHGRQGREKSFDNTGLYLMELERLSYPARLESFIGYGTLRATVAGCQAGLPDGQELEQLCGRVRSGLNSGAKGISFGLAYPPCSDLEDGELEAVLRTAAQCGGRAAVQLFPDREGLLPALERAGRLALETGVSLTVTNLHAPGAGRDLGEAVCRLWDGFRARGADVALAVTGRCAQPLGLMALTPGSLWTELGELLLPREGPGRDEAAAEAARRLAAAGGPAALTLTLREGETTLEQEAARRGCPPEELVLSLLEGGGPVHALLRTDDEEFMARLLEEPYTALCTDGLSLSGEDDHAVPWFLGHYVLERGLLSLEEAVRRNTMAQAARLGLWDRGLIREGMTADLALLRPEQLPRRPGDSPARGISKVWTAGVLQYDTEASASLGDLPKTKMFGIRMS